MRSKRGYKWLSLPLIAGISLALTGCSSEEFANGYLPLKSIGATNHTEEITNLWTSSWIILWGVGFLAWGLMAWALIVYRRRKGDTSTPPQMRYNNPIETLFTVVPFILVVGFFAMTAKTMTNIERPVESKYEIQAIGKQWAWDFNYLGTDKGTSDDTYSSGIQFQDDQAGGAEEGLPTLYLPVNQSIKIDLSSRDVVHSFWIVDFLYKKDVFPGKWNYMYVTPTKTGTYMGKCAELCGEFHSMMLFTVKVVEQSEYDAYIQSLRDKGQTGILSIDGSRNMNLPGNGSEGN